MKHVNRKQPIAFDLRAYKDSNRVERMFTGSSSSTASPPDTTKQPVSFLGFLRRKAMDANSCRQVL